MQGSDGGASGASVTQTTVPSSERSERGTDERTSERSERSERAKKSRVSVSERGNVSSIFCQFFAMLPSTYSTRILAPNKYCYLSILSCLCNVIYSILQMNKKLVSVLTLFCDFGHFWKILVTIRFQIRVKAGFILNPISPIEISTFSGIVLIIAGFGFKKSGIY